MCRFGRVLFREVLERSQNGEQLQGEGREGKSGGGWEVGERGRGRGRREVGGVESLLSFSVPFFFFSHFLYFKWSLWTNF